MQCLLHFHVQLLLLPVSLLKAPAHITIEVIKVHGFGGTSNSGNCDSWRLSFQVSQSELRYKVKILFLCTWQHSPSHLCWLLILQWWLSLEHIVKSHCETCLFGVCSYLQTLFTTQVFVSINESDHIRPTYLRFKRLPSYTIIGE